MKHVLSRILVVAAAVLIPLGVIAGWANSTVFESATFSQRATGLLESQPIRREVGIHLTDKLAEGGYQPAVNFRPALQLAIEGAAASDSFQSIFRTAIARAHGDLLAGRAGGVDLSDGIGVIASTLQLPDNAKPGTKEAPSFGKVFAGATETVDRLSVWRWEDLSHALWLVGLFGGLAAAAGAIALATDRIQVVQRLGWVLVADGVLIAAVVLVLQWLAGSQIADNELAGAVSDGVGRLAGDLRTIGLWVAAYGVVVVAAASATRGRRLTPSVVASTFGAWLERRRATTRGTVAISAAGIVAGLLLIRYHRFWLSVAVFVVALWLVYLSVTELIFLVQRTAPAAPDAATAPVRRHRFGIIAGVTVVVLALLSAGLVLTTRGAVEKAHSAGETLCNGEAKLCDVPLNLAMLPATHNSMSSVRYPGWMQAEHIKTIRQQLESGVRALLIDTHYGIPSSARMPGSETQLVITDRAKELELPTGEQARADPRIVERAQQLAARASPKAGAQSGLYLCHNWCEMGAIRFSDGLAEVKDFVDSHPDEVVILDIEDHTRPPETAAAIEKAGLAERAWTLDPKLPMPTLGQMIAEGRNVLIFAEAGGPGAPPWYQPAYEHWIQETPFTWANEGEMNCEPNRGRADAPLLLVNHWVEAAPPDPRKAKSANRQEFLEARLRNCLADRGLVPNLVAVDFSESGKLFSTLDDIDDLLLAQFRSAGRRGSRAPPAAAPRPHASKDSSGVTVAISPLAPIPPPTPVTSLTGGDPAAFCAAFNVADEVVSSWAEAHYVALSSEEGLPDLAYGVAAVSALDAIAGSAPTEIAELLPVTRNRASAAAQALQELGVKPEFLGQHIEFVHGLAGGRSDAEAATPNQLEAIFVGTLQDEVGVERLTAAAQAFAASHPAEPTLFDLGYPPDDVARATGYTCLLSQGA